MANYKGIEVDDAVRPLLPHMAMVEDYRESLQALQAVWDNLNLLGQMSGTTAEMGRTREAFTTLTGDLLNSLAERTLAKRCQEMAAKAQMVIDVLIRNLFERTADIGFLATDDDIRSFLSRPDDALRLQQRFREYVAKYSVYEDIVLLSPDGRVLVRLQDEVQVGAVTEAWVREAQTTRAGYVERYGRSQLFPERPPVLIYAYRVTGSGGETLGVLALGFRFADEMQRIFRSLLQAGDPGVMALLDCNGQVIASSDRWQVPLGAEIVMPQGGVQRVRFAGRSYLAVACPTKGYQGYFGPGWRGLVMLPLAQAFEFQEDDEPGAAIPSRLLPSVLAGRAFPASLRAIPRKADAIQRDLNRSVWNGTVRHSSGNSTASNPAFSKILLWEISRTAMRMREVFARSIGNLQTTVLSSLLADCRHFASLAIDIMDRNLYERANDCRWWALDPGIRRLLAGPAGNAQSEGLGKVLSYINSLYTVYDNLLVFDTQGVVVAVSNPAQAERVGQPLGESWVDACLALDDSQRYAVSPFAPTPLYDGRPTYAYLAAIRAPETSRVIGGIAIVFDSEPQFAAMLSDALPHETSGETVAGSFALFVDAGGHVIASSSAAYRVGERVELPAELCDVPPEGRAMLIEFAGQVMAVGARRSAGYREYKGAADAYRNDVSALVFMPLGDFDPAATLPAAGGEVGRQRAISDSGRIGREIATFYLGAYWLGLPIEAVVEAVELVSAARLPNAPPQVYGAFLHRGDTLPLYNLHAALGLAPPAEEGARCQVVVIRGDDGTRFGILVDALGEVPDVPLDAIADVSSIYVGVTPVLASLVKVSEEPGAPMLTLLSVSSMASSLRG